MASIRLYRTSDLENMIQVFRETAAPDLRSYSDPDVLDVGSFMWCRSYLALTPDWCFVLDDGQGKAVGYILCAPDTAAFVRRYKEEFFPVIAKHGITQSQEPNAASALGRQFRRDVYQPESMLQGDYPNLVRQYPAHFHIDILSSHQRQCWGQKLVDTVLRKLKSEQVSGIHLSMVAGNFGAVRFYERLGFTRFSDMSDQNETGRTGDSLHLVQEVTG